jgi:hypothetical protein
MVKVAESSQERVPRSGLPTPTLACRSGDFSLFRRRASHPPKKDAELVDLANPRSTYK